MFYYGGFDLVMCFSPSPAPSSAPSTGLCCPSAGTGSWGSGWSRTCSDPQREQITWDAPLNIQVLFVLRCWKFPKDRNQLESQRLRTVSGFLRTLETRTNTLRASEQQLNQTNQRTNCPIPEGTAWQKACLRKRTALTNAASESICVKCITRKKSFAKLL